MATAKKPAKAGPPVRKQPTAVPRPSRQAAKPASQPPASMAAPEAGKASKADKPKKPKLVRDSFTIPKAEYAVLQQLKQRAAQAGAPAKKSEVLRAGLKALAAMEDAAFIAALDAVPALKTGRPAKS